MANNTVDLSGLNTLDIPSVYYCQAKRRSRQFLMQKSCELKLKPPLNLDCLGLKI